MDRKSVVKSRCIGTTKLGKRCKNRTIDVLCHLHHDEKKTTMKTTKMGTTKTKRRPDALTLDDWVKQATKWQVTIKDILALDQGEKLDLCIFHRNWRDIVEPKWTKKEKGVVVRPERAFRAIHFKYTHKKNLNGTMFDGTVEVEPSEFEWHVNVKGHGWMPPDKHGYVKLKLNDKHTPPRMHWTDFPPKTAIGWRGMAIPWEKVTSGPSIFAQRSDFSLEDG